MLVLLALAAAGAAYERVSVQRVTERAPAPGELVQVGGATVHLHCVGEGLPTVLIEAGAGSFSLDWSAVQRTLSSRTRVCAYDRPGLGWSPPLDGGEAWDPAADVPRLLAAAGEVGPFVLVGHSLGGLYVQGIAHRHPDEVVGVVLVDSAHPRQHEWLPPAALEAHEEGYRQLRLFAALARIGIPRLVLALDPSMAGDLSALSPEERRWRIGISASSRYLRSVADEAGSVDGVLARAGVAPAAFPDVPLVVVARGRADPVPGLSPADAEATERAWREMQVKLAGLSPQGRLVVAENSGHNVMLDEPEVVVRAVEQVLEAARERAEREPDAFV